MDDDIGPGTTNDDSCDKDESNETADTNSDGGGDADKNDDDDDDDDDDVNGSKKDIDLANINAGDLENKVDLEDLQGSGDGCIDDGRVADVGEIAAMLKIL